jgi:carboxymethylenebutenolidase
MRRALEGAHSRSRIVVFPEAPHGFHADYRPTYRPREAAEGWKQMRAWLRANGVA